MLRSSLACLALVLSLEACKKDTPPAPSAAPSATVTTASSASGVTPAASASAASSAVMPAGAPREGSTVARSLAGGRVLVADEENRTLRVVSLTASGETVSDPVPLPGAPGQVLALPGRVLVAVRDPGLLLVLRDDGGALVETQRIPVPADAWGLALAPDGRVVVTSPWTARVSLVDLAAGKPVWSVGVAREPRAAVVRPDGAGVYVTHLTAGTLSRLSLADGQATTVDLPPAPLRAPTGRVLRGTLGYTAVLSADGRRLFAARHAVGALGHEAWFGASTVDVLLTGDDRPLSPRYQPGAPRLKSDLASTLVSGGDVEFPGGSLGAFTQPRALVLRRSAETLLVASEGNDELVELDARAVDPTLAIRHVYAVGKEIDPIFAVSTTCGAPSGIALSDDEATAYVHCRATQSLAVVPLEPVSGGEVNAPRFLRLIDERADDPEVRGRRMFYSARDTMVSGGLGCAGCHPEGRDDGQVWHEAVFTTAAGDNANFVGLDANVPSEARKKGVARRTPLLVDRIGHAGPYGWRGESKDLTARLHAGFGLHRWGGLPTHTPANLDARAAPLIAFVRKGLPAPPGIGRPLTPEEERGKALFESEKSQCASCHPAGEGYTTRAVLPLPERPTLPGYDREADAAYKVPSLVHLAGHAPYFHDGSAPSIEALIDQNKDRMGKTTWMSPEERAALVAFLRTL